MNVSKIIISFVASALITSSFAAGVKLELQESPQSTNIAKKDHGCCKCDADHKHYQNEAQSTAVAKKDHGCCKCHRDHKSYQAEEQHMGDNTSDDKNTTTAM